MKYLMLMWVENDAAGGTQEDIDAWAAFESEAKSANVLVMGSALQPAAKTSKLVSSAASNSRGSKEVSSGTFSYTKGQIEAFYILDCHDENHATTWAQKLPTWGVVEVRPFLEYDLSQ